jgi:iron complex transport system substrate-binding protein
LTKLNFKLFIVFCILGCVLFACKTESVPTNTANSREVVDDLGRKVKLPAKIERAVSLAPNLTENIFAIGAGDKLIGVTTYCNFPAETSKIQKVGDTLNPNIETIIALKPDVVFVSTASQLEAFISQFDKQNISVFVTNPTNIEGIYQSVLQLGGVLGENEKAKILVGSLKKRAEDVEARTISAKQIKVFVQISKEPLFTVGKTSFITDLIGRAGGISVTQDVNEAYPKFSKETALALQPEAIILSDSDDNREPNDIFKNSPAMKNGKVFKINADLLSRPGPRTFDALEQIAEKLNQ